MPAPPERVLVLHDRPDDFSELLGRRLAGVPVGFATRPEEVEEALERLRPTAVLSIKHSDYPGPAHRPALLAPSVRWFHVGGSGFEHLETWDPARVAVTNCAGVLAPFLAEMAMAALLSLAVGLPSFARDQRDRRWRPRRFRPVAGRTILIVGVGAVGGAIAERAAAMGLRVLGVRRSGTPHPAVERMAGPGALPELLPRADIVSLNVRLTEETVGMMGERELRAMKSGALLLNAARGAVVDEAALVRVLRDGHLGGAWLDVFEREPLPTASPLWELPKVLVTPHCADQVHDFPRRFAARFCDLYDARARGERLPTLVPPPRSA